MKIKKNTRHVSTQLKTSADPRITRLLEGRFMEGKAAERAEQFDVAETIYREVVAGFERHRFNAASPNAALGYVLLHQKKLTEAESVLKRSVRLNQDLLEGHANLAAIYRLREKWDSCMAASQRALEIDPKHVPSLLNLAEGLKETRQFSVSVQKFLLVLSLDNDNLEARKGLASNYISLGETSVSIPMFRKILEMNPEAWAYRSFMAFAMQYEAAISNEEVLQEHLLYGRCVRNEVGPPATQFDNDFDNPGRRMRIGYVSGDFCYHVVMRFAEQVFALHDRREVELFLIHSSPKKDKDTERIKALPEHWVEIGGMTEEESADKVRALNLDILVDLAGHSGITKLPLMARRLAPIQMLWLGYSGTSGVDTMDYILVDNVLSPPGERTYFSEEPLRLPYSYLCFGEKNGRPIAALPYERNGYITFGCMNNPSKINAHVVSWWAKILHAVPSAKLLLRYVLYVDPLVKERIAKMLRANGVPPERYEMKMGAAEFLSVYDDVDIALDTFPYNGTTTTCEALWMGVPVVALRGDRFVSRVGASILTFTGLKDLVTESPEHYIQLATELAGEPKHLADLRTQLRPHLTTTPVFDGKLFTEGLEHCYRQVFQKWCQERKQTVELSLAS